MSTTSECSHCQHPVSEEGYVNQLCADCRRTLSRSPIDNWVKWLAALVALLFIISLFNLPKVLTANIAYKSADRFMEEHKFISAENAFHKIAAAYPKDFRSCAKLAIAAYYNQHYRVTDSVLNKWSGRHVEEEELVSQLNSLPDISQYYFIEDTKVEKSLDSATTTHARIEVLKEYHLAHQSDVPVMFRLASEYYDDSSYAATIALCEEIRMENPEAFMLYPLLAAAYREQKEYDKAMGVCNHILEINAESILGLNAKTKVLLKWKKDSEALSVAKQAYSLDPQNTWAMEVMALAAHFNGDKDTRDKMMAGLQQLEDSSSVSFLEDVITDKINYRN